MITLGRGELSLLSKPARIVSALALCLGLAPFQTTATASQAPKSKIDQELEKKNTPAKKTEVNKGRTRAPRSASSSSKSDVQFSVTIISDVPGAEIYVDDTWVGTTDGSKKLTTRLKKGQHKITASRKGYETQAGTISVFSNEVTHSISLGKPLAPPVEPIAKAEPTPAPAPSPPPPSPDDIIKRFISPKEASTVSADDWKEVIAQSERALRAEPTNPQLSARLHLARGQLAYVKKNYAESLSEFNRAIEVMPLSGIAYYGLGNAYLATNQPVEAHKSYQRAIELTPEVSAVALKGVGDSLSTLEKRSEANSSYMRAREAGYLSPELNKSIALNLIQEKNWPKALTELRAMENADASAEIQLYMGECYENLKRPLSAYRAYAAAARLDSNSPAAFSRLGDLLFENNEFSEAKEAYERALALDITGAVINRALLRKQADRAAQLAKQGTEFPTQKKKKKKEEGK